MPEQTYPLITALAEANTPQWQEKVARDDKFLREVIYNGIPDRNTGFDSPSVSHFSPRDFLTVIDRCETMNVRDQWDRDL